MVDVLVTGFAWNPQSIYCELHGKMFLWLLFFYQHLGISVHVKAITFTGLNAGQHRKTGAQLHMGY